MIVAFLLQFQAVLLYSCSCVAGSGPCDPERGGRTITRKQFIWDKIRGWIKSPFYCLYQKRLIAHIPEWSIPQHLGIVLDGNRRWARKEGYNDVCRGHAYGAEKVHEVLQWCFDIGINTVTVWVFSTENTGRAQEEVDGLMRLFEKKAKEFMNDPRVHDNEVRVRFIGQIETLPQNVQDAIAGAEKATEDYEKFNLNVAIAYGGQSEITDGFKKLLHERCIDKGEDLETVLESLQPDDIRPYLYMADLPDPDLIIRTSGEVRLSGFLLWQSAYAEYYFCDTFWPAFRKIDFLRAIRSYSRRQRRFGK